METPGKKLRDARAARSLSLEDVANVTRIPRSSLESLENGDYDRLPAPVFIRGFMRAYARTVGLDGASVVRLYDLSQGHEDAEDAPETVAGRARTVSPVRTSQTSGGTQIVRGGYALLGAVVIGLVVAAWALVGNQKTPSEASANGTPTPLLHDRIDGIDDIGAETPIRLR